MVQYSPQPSSSRGPTQGWSVSFVKSISGILKIVELVLSLIAFICAVVPGFGWPSFVGIAAFIHVAVSFIVHILNYFPDQTIAYVIELIVYAVFSLFWFAAAINSAVLAAIIADSYLYRYHYHHYEPAIAAAVFGFFCLIIWSVDTLLQLLAVIASRRQSPPSAAPAATASSPT